MSLDPPPPTLQAESHSASVSVPEQQFSSRTGPIPLLLWKLHCKSDFNRNLNGFFDSINIDVIRLDFMHKVVRNTRVFILEHALFGVKLLI